MEIQNFFYKPGSDVWAALLSSCQLHGPLFSVLSNFFLYAGVQNMQVTHKDRDKNIRQTKELQCRKYSIPGSTIVVVKDGLWISSIAVIHNADHWGFFKLNSRRCERRPLNFAKGRRSQRRSMPPCSTAY